jgi:tetratricopeptide (TPR) repeat protein
MKLSHIRSVCKFLFIGVAATAFSGLVGCSSIQGMDLLTWAKDAKNEGIRKYNDGKYDAAAGCFRNAIRQDPTDPETEYWLALCYEQTHSYHEAIDAYKTSLQLMPAPGTAHYNRPMHDSAFDRLAHVVAANDPTGSEVDLIASAAAKGDASEQYRLLGRIFRYHGDADTSLDNYRKAVKLQPENFNAQRELGLYLEQLTQNEEAGQVLRDAYRINQHDDQVNAGLRRIGIEPGDSLLEQAAPISSMKPPVMPALPAVDPGLPTPAANTYTPSPESPAPRD